MLVGLHTYGRSLTQADIEQLRQLDPEKVCLFVDQAAYEGMSHLQEQNIRMCAADVDEEDHAPPCSMPECMVFVGAEGKLYTCGLVLGDRNFCFGSVLDKRLEDILQDDSLPRSIPADIPHHKGRCDGCPPIMAKRVMENFG